MSCSLELLTSVELNPLEALPVPDKSDNFGEEGYNIVLTAVNEQVKNTEQ